MNASRAERAGLRWHVTAALACFVLSSARAALAQDFAPAAAAGPRPGPAALLDRALPVANEALAVEGGEIRWFALPGLETRALSLLVPVRSVRVAAGLSQTGDGELGWTTAALSIGEVSESFGLALRAAVRRDRAPGELLSSAAALGAGAEAGGGAHSA